MIRLNQTVIVEGKYDKARLTTLVDANILTTDGFAIFKDPAKLRLIQTLAAHTGIVILTDSDRAGFQIRSHIAGSLPSEQVIHVYIPDIYGKERRKATPGAEGKLGVEGVPDEVIMASFAKAGLISAVDTGTGVEQRTPITSADLWELGLSGGENSHTARLQLLTALELPSRLGTKALLRIVNALYDRDTFLALAQNVGKVLER